jgi:hypothetical protein
VKAAGPWPSSGANVDDLEQKLSVKRQPRPRQKREQSVRTSGNPSVAFSKRRRGHMPRRD